MTTTPPRKESIARLASIVRELFNSDEFKHVAHYAALLADLQDAHDRRNEFAEGSAQWHREHEHATKQYHAARVYALRYKLESPNDVMRASGYNV
jgi:hypothetical protein